MDLLAKFDINLHSLICFMALPFLYFFYHVQNRFWVSRMNRANVIFLVVITSLGLAVAAKIHSADPGNPIPTDLVSAHFIALGLGILIFIATRTARVTVQTSAHGGHNTAGPAPAYAPLPLNREVERVTWNDLIVDQSLKEELSSIIRLLKDPKVAQKYGIEVPRGILLNGLPGTGKTTVAKVIATQAGLSFFALKADEVISKWVGDSEKNLSALFDAAKRHAPAVIFIDEIDSIGKQRSGAGGQEHRESFLNHLLQMLDGIVHAKGIYVIAATNRADLVDSALKRPGRLNKVVDIPLPDLTARKQLFQLYLSRIELADRIDIEVLAKMTESRSPAVIKEICNQAGLNAFKREAITGGAPNYTVTRGDMELALAEFL